MPKKKRSQRTSTRPAQHRRLLRWPPGWVIGAVLYGLSWPLAEGLNLSFLAWFAFVPLFLELERHDTFRPFVLRAVGFMALAGFIACWWVFFAVPPEVLLKTWIGGIHEIVLEATPLLFLYGLRKKVSYHKALWMLVFIWPLWEWLYNQWELSMGYYLLAHAQAGNIWLVQYVDLFGVWAITAWVVLFNVLLYRAFKKHHERFTPAFWKHSLAVAALMVGVPGLYGVYRFSTVEADDEIRVTMIHTDFDPVRLSQEESIRRLERVVHLTDSSAYYTRQLSDLYVWPEATVPFGWTFGNTQRFLYEAVNTWDTPLLMGHTGWRTTALGDTIQVNQAVLIPVEGDTLKTLHEYNKRRFVPFQEGLPHYRQLQVFPAVRAFHKKGSYFTPGEAATRLPLVTRAGRILQLGTPICHEQQFPALWTDWTTQGVDLFVHLSFESWFGDRTFQTQFVNITRLRSIENRRSMVRSSNGGHSVVIDALGSTSYANRRGEEAITGLVKIYSGKTFYAHYPNIFAWICLLSLVGIGVVPYRMRQRVLE